MTLADKCKVIVANNIRTHLIQGNHIKQEADRALNTKRPAMNLSHMPAKILSVQTLKQTKLIPSI